jgi:hypothetical protein
MDAPGNIQFIDVDVQGEREANAFIKHTDENIDPWLRDLSNSISARAFVLVKQNAPANVKPLVHFQPMLALGPDGVRIPQDAIVGVTPAIEMKPKYVYKGNGVYALEVPIQKPGKSDPKHFPVFMEVGTGEYGEFGKPITRDAGSGIMSWGEPEARHFALAVPGQRGQHFVRRAWATTVSGVPAQVRMRLPSLGAP